MRSCAAAGASASSEKQRNTIVRLRMMSDPIKLPVLPDRVEILPKFGAVLEPAHQVIEARDGNDGNSVALLDFPDRRQISLTSLHPVDRNDHPRNDRVVPFDDIERLAHCGARGQYIIHDQHAARKRCTDKLAAFSVIFCLFAIESEGHIAAFAREGSRRARCKDDALVGGTEQHVELHARGEDRFCVELRQALQGRSRVEQAGIEEIGRDASGLHYEPAELQRILLDAECNEVLAKVGHELFFEREFAKCYALSRSTSTASARRSPRVFHGGSRAGAPTWYAYRKSRHRKRTSWTWRSSPRDITATITAARRRRVTAASDCTPGPNPRAFPAV